MLDLNFTPEQEMLRDVVRSLVTEHAPLSVVREMEDDPHGFPPELWKRLADLDLVGLLLPEEHGGSGMGLLEGVVLYEELGRGLTPVPHLASSVLAGGLLTRLGATEWLPRLASGEAVFAPAWLEPDGGFGPEGIRTTATPAPDGDGDGNGDGSDGDFVLDGVKRHVHFAKAADRLVVLARTGDDIGYFLVAPDAPGVTLTQQFSLASDTQYRVDLAGARAQRLGT
ncbi:MAG TPA: acyl-CoA dehydrogenase family protein, partial [Acidimicrobiales bacterium]